MKVRKAEIWKQIPDFENYEVSNHGRVRSLKNGLLKPCVNKHHGYLYVTLSKKGKTKFFYIHSLVLITFKGVRPKDLEAAHKNGNKLDNYIGNLIWTTHAKNVSHKKLHGTTSRGIDRPASKLTEEDVICIRREYSAGHISQRMLAEAFEVSQTTINDITSGKLWKHVGGPLTSPTRNRKVWAKPAS